MYRDGVNDNNNYYHESFKRKVTTKQIIDYIVNIDDEFKHTYQTYQELLWCFKYQNKERFYEVIHHTIDNVSEYMKTALKTLKQYKDLVIDSMISK